MEFTRQVPPPRLGLTDSIIRPSREHSENRPDHLLWLDKNENMDPTYINIIQNMLLEMPKKALFSYPDCFVLYKKLSAYLHVSINQLILSAGSDGIIRAVYEAFISPGDTVIYTEPTFAMYSLYAEIYEANSLLLHYQASAHGPLLLVSKVINAIETARPKLICLPNPNSPSGTVFSPEDLQQIILAANKVHAVILIDEAYYPFYSETVLPWINQYQNLIIARTFSKAWGCAGIRLGYGIANKELIAQLHKIRPMYEAGSLSILLAERLLDYADEMLHSVHRLNAGKQYFLTEMKKLHLRSFHSEGNFLHVAFDQYAIAAHTMLADKLLYRKDFLHPSLSGYSRFTATTKELYLPIIEAIKKTILSTADKLTCLPDTLYT